MINGGEEFSCIGLIPVKSSCIGIILVKELGPGGHVFPVEALFALSSRAFPCISVRYQVQNIFVNFSDGSCWELIIIRQIHTYTSNIIVLATTFRSGLPQPLSSQMARRERESYILVGFSFSSCHLT